MRGQRGKRSMSNEPYKAQEIEQKWRRRWEERGMHTVSDTDPRPKYYCLDMFPYPSGSGLHVGHCRGYVLSDVWSRYQTLHGYKVVDGACERCGTPVIKKEMQQWMLRITRYAERLLRDLDKLEWPEKVKTMQANWIGRSEGATVTFTAISARDSSQHDLRIFTTRPDTLFGATYMVLAPEHPLVNILCAPEREAAVQGYVTESRRRSDIERSNVERTKTGVDLGAVAINPVNGAKIPIWIADYVLMGYGTGAIMAVPGHDERDFEF